MQNRPSIIWVWVLIAYFGAIVVRRYLIRPWRWRKFWLPGKQPLVPAPIDEWPDEFRASALISLRALAAEGFVAMGYFKTDFSQQNAQSIYSAFWLDRVRHDLAVVRCQRAPRFRGDDLVSAELVISRLFDDGTDCETAQVDRMPYLPRPSTSRMVFVSRIGNPAELIAVHRHWVNRDGGDRVDTLDLEAEHQKQTDLLIASGDFRLNEDGSKLVPTVRGMYAMTWRRLWPMRQWRDMRDRSAGARVIRAWEKAKKTL